MRSLSRRNWLADSDRQSNQEGIRRWICTPALMGSPIDGSNQATIGLPGSSHTKEGRVPRVLHANLPIYWIWRNWGSIPHVLLFLFNDIIDIDAHAALARVPFGYFLGRSKGLVYLANGDSDVILVYIAMNVAHES